MCTGYVASTMVWEEFTTNTMSLKGRTFCQKKVGKPRLG